MFCFSEKQQCSASITRITGGGSRNVFLQAALAPEPCSRSGSVGAAFSLANDGAELAPGVHHHHDTGDPRHLVYFRFH